MKKYRKILSLALAAVLVLMMVAACADGGGGGAGSSGSAARGDATHLTLMAVNANFTHRTDPILEAINDYLAEQIGVTIEVKSVDQEAYKINLAGLDGIDLIHAFDYLDYYDNARAGAYQEIPMEMIRELMPVFYRENSDKFPAVTVEGKVFAIPGPRPGLNAPAAILRRDWFPPGMTEIRGLEDLGTYFQHVLDTQPGVVPFHQSVGDVMWINGAFAFGATFLMAPGSPNCTSTVVFDKRADPNYTLLTNWAQPQIVYFFEYMREFYQMGAWTADAMNNQDSLWDSFPDSRSAMMWNLNVAGINGVWESIQQRSPGAEIYVYDFGKEFGVPIDTESPAAGALAIPMNGNNMEASLKLIELLYTDVFAYRLFAYGVEGEDWWLNDEGEVVRDDVEAGIGFWGFAQNSDFDLVPDGGYWPGYLAYRATVTPRLFQNPFAAFTINNDPVSEIAGALWSVHEMYAVPIYLGMVDDVEEAIAELLRQYDLAGYDAYYNEMFNQLTTFLETTFPGGQFTLAREPGR